MNYNESIYFLDHTNKFGRVLGLDNILRLLEQLDNPQNKLKVLHIAGTNGKGSVSNLIANVLQSASYNVGLFNSPHILSYREIIKHNNEMISEENFAITTTKINQACQSMIKHGYEHPTLFECITAIAIDYFATKNVDFAVIEVGLGGTLDATNVFDTPLLSIITSIGFDHMDFLGNTLEDIAKAKAGIIKPNTSVVIAPNEPEVLRVLTDKACNNNANYYALSSSNTDITIHEESINGSLFSITTPYYNYDHLAINLVGRHQLANVSVALTVFHILNSQYSIKVPTQAIYDGLSNTYWPNRCEYIKDTCPMLFDGSHNKKSIEALTNVLTQYFENTKIILLMGLLKDKMVDEIFHLLAPYTDTIVLTRPLSDRAMPLKELESIATPYFSSITIIEDPLKAFDYAKKLTNNDGLLCCTGSLYLTTPLRQYVKS